MSFEGTGLQLPAKPPADGGLGETRQRLAKTPLKLRQNSLAGKIYAASKKMKQRFRLYRRNRGMSAWTRHAGIFEDRSDILQVKVG